MQVQLSEFTGKERHAVFPTSVAEKIPLPDFNPLEPGLVVQGMALIHFTFVTGCFPPMCSRRPFACRSCLNSLSHVLADSDTECFRFSINGDFVFPTITVIVV
jgi:hypothetical protein